MTVPGAAPPPEPLKGGPRQLGAFAATARLATGRRTTAFLGQREHQSSLYVLRELNRGLDPEIFEAELRAIRGFDGAQTGPEVFRVEGSVISATRAAVGESLATILARAMDSERALDLDIAIAIAMGVAGRMAQAGERRFHGDLVPHHVIVGYDGSVELIDPAGAAYRERMKAPDRSGYRAPEQIRGEPVGPHADVFQLGILLFEMSTGTRLYGQPSWRENETAILEGRFPRPRDLVGDGYPIELQLVLRKLLRPLPAGRFPDGGAARDALRLVAAARGEVTAAQVGTWMRRAFPERYQLWRGLVIDAAEALARPRARPSSRDPTRVASSDDLSPVERADTVRLVPDAARGWPPHSAQSPQLPMPAVTEEGPIPALDRLFKTDPDGHRPLSHLAPQAPDTAPSASSPGPTLDADRRPRAVPVLERFDNDESTDNIDTLETRPQPLPPRAERALYTESNTPTPDAGFEAETLAAIARPVPGGLAASPGAKRAISAQTDLSDTDVGVPLAALDLTPDELSPATLADTDPSAATMNEAGSTAGGRLGDTDPINSENTGPRRLRGRVASDLLLPDPPIATGRALDLASDLLEPNEEEALHKTIRVEAPAKSGDLERGAAPAGGSVGPGKETSRTERAQDRRAEGDASELNTPAPTGLAPSRPEAPAEGRGGPREGAGWPTAKPAESPRGSEPAREGAGKPFEAILQWPAGQAADPLSTPPPVQPANPLLAQSQVPTQIVRDRHLPTATESARSQRASDTPPSQARPPHGGPAAPSRPATSSSPSDESASMALVIPITDDELNRVTRRRRLVVGALAALAVAGIIALWTTTTLDDGSPIKAWLDPPAPPRSAPRPSAPGTASATTALAAASATTAPGLESARAGEGAPGSEPRAPAVPGPVRATVRIVVSPRSARPRIRANGVESDLAIEVRDEPVEIVISAPGYADEIRQVGPDSPRNLKVNLHRKRGSGR